LTSSAPSRIRHAGRDDRQQALDARRQGLKYPQVGHIRERSIDSPVSGTRHQELGSENRGGQPVFARDQPELHVRRQRPDRVVTWLVGNPELHAPGV
jgi:hypothetical protein